MQTKKIILVMIFTFLSALAVNVSAQDLTGRWEGTLLWAGNAGVKDEVYDWEAGKWQNTTRTPNKFVLELEKGDEDNKYQGSYNWANGTNLLKFSAIFEDSLLKGSSGAIIKGGRQWGGYVELKYREEDGKKYLEGSWRTSEKTNVWEGRVALRLAESE